MTLSRGSLGSWLDALGYGEDHTLHLASEVVSSTHPYSIEVRELLRPDGPIGAAAVFDVQGTPTVAFLYDDGSLLNDTGRLAALRQRIWNQNLISVVMVASPERLTAWPLNKKATTPDSIERGSASANGPLSAAEIRSNEIQQRHPEWFRPENRVDQHLLRNLAASVELLVERAQLSVEVAQLLMGQVLFVSYLEHRQIVSDTYRQKRQVGRLNELIQARDRKGLQRLIDCLHEDFNGDFLLEADKARMWQKSAEGSLGVLGDFLERVDMRTGQLDFWNYDFSFIPVELLSGIYESFIGDQKGALGAYYTPRHLANLVVDQALSDSPDPLQEVIYDGACGSGILLTTAFRRLVGISEARAGKQLSLAGRIALLKRAIFGSDVSEAACRVTAFSLYLSLLERLEPTDVLSLQDNEDVKLPTLRDTNLVGGDPRGDFFSDQNPFFATPRFTLLISNPPWREPKKSERTSADVWAENRRAVTARRQLAVYFAARALECLRPDGRLCFIMPASVFLAPTSGRFLQSWLMQVRIDRLINFGDMRAFIFEKAAHSCAVVLASPRSGTDERVIPADETFQYWAPKSDLSLAFGRLTLSSVDRFDVQTQAYFEDPGRLVTLMWGNEEDIALWRRLQWRGTFGELFHDKPERRWVSRKGVHLIDNSREPTSAAPLYRMPEVPIEALKRGWPVIAADDLRPFPRRIKQVARISKELREVFRGPRVLFPDGSDSGREIRTCFIDVPASFTSSIGVIAGPDADAELLRFAAVYLRSDLVKYFTIMRAYQAVVDRTRVSLQNLSDIPFVRPERHSNPREARAILARVGKLVAPFMKSRTLRSLSEFDECREALNDLVYDYFELEPRARALVKEAVTELLPSSHPRGYSALKTRIQEPTNMGQMKSYMARLKAELSDWQHSLGGQGTLDVTVVAMEVGNAGALGAVRIDLGGKQSPARGEVTRDDAAMLAVVRSLREQKLLPMPLGELYFAPHTIIWTNRSAYLIRPLTRRFWLQRMAIVDARRLVEETHRHAEAASSAAAPSIRQG